MQSVQTELENVIYNAAEQAFEAKVIVRQGSHAHSYACSINAPISMEFDDAARGLAKQALRKHGKPAGLRSRFTETPVRYVVRMMRPRLRRGLPLGQYGFFRGRAA